MTEADVSAAIIGHRVARLRELVEAACERAGRPSYDVGIVAAAKTRSAEEVALALAAGVICFGENRPEEAAPKMEAVAGLVQARGLPPPEWHMIGHIQSRKARLVACRYDLTHSLDSAKLAAKLCRLADEAGCTVRALLEVNVGGEDSKYGFMGPAEDGAPDDAFLADLEAILALPRLEVRGLMTMAPVAPRPDEARPYFRRLRLLSERLQQRYPEVTWEHLSMGMSDDFEVAIEEGASLVRIGRAIFGERRPA